jgi:glycosyltransferase involved in cell wall biosynthesis
MVGGIYTVLSTRASVLQQRHGDKLIFIGPDVWKGKTNQYFTEDPELWADWKAYTKKKYNLSIRIGRWNVPGNPIAVLVDFEPLFSKKDEIFGQVWEKFGVNSIAAYGDYDESAMFSYSAGMVIESFYKFFKLTKKQRVATHFNEWQTAFGICYVKEFLPNVATLFTTHATSIGRSIAGNHKPLYNYLNEYDGTQMSYELNMVSKHSAEKTAAHLADCFTTVSEITARECTQLLGKTPDIVTPNGFEDDFVPKARIFTKKRKEARESLRRVAETLFGYKLQDNAIFIGTAGRYEYKNKGLDVFTESLRRLSEMNPEREIVAFFVIPAHIKHKRADLAHSLQHPESPLASWNRYTTHELHHYERDSIIDGIRWFHLQNEAHEKVKIVFIPSYLDGNDGIFNKTYYDILIGLDLTVFASYYEPWGYTPLESIAFSVPTITTNLSGFGQWVSPHPQHIDTSVGIIHREDYNGAEVAAKIAEMIYDFASYDEPKVKKLRKTALEIAQKAHWQHFIHYYEKAYDIALRKIFAI